MTIASEGRSHYEWYFEWGGGSIFGDDVWWASGITPFSDNSVTAGELNNHYPDPPPHHTSGDHEYPFSKSETFTATRPYIVDHYASDRHLGVVGGSSTWTIEGSASLTYSYTPTGTLSGSLTVGAAATDIATYTHDGSTLTITDDLVIGDAGAATFTQSSGLITVQGNTILGKQATGNGTYNLSSTGRLTTNNDLIVGKYGTGTFNQSGGTNTVSGTLKIAKESGSHGTYNLSGGLLTAASVVNNGSFNFTGGTASISTLTGTGSLSVGSGRALALNQLRQASLTVNGSVSIASNGGNASMVFLNTLSVGGSAKLDLNDNDLVVNNGSFSAIQALVFSGYSASVDTTKTGIVSTHGQGLSGVTILALFDNATLGITEWPLSSGQTVGANAIISKYTYIGDADLDGQVTPQDYTVVDSNLNSTNVDPGVAWVLGDMDFDLNITPQDYSAIDLALGLGVGSPLAATGITAVPEPSSLALLSLGAVGLRRRRATPSVAPRN